MSQFNESQHPRGGDGKFASKGPAAEAGGVSLDDAAAERDYLESEAHKGMEMIREDFRYTEMDVAAEEDREERDIASMDFDPEGAEMFRNDMAEFRANNRADWDAYEAQDESKSPGEAYALARLGQEGFSSTDHELNKRLAIASMKQRDLSPEVGDNGKIILE